MKLLESATFEFEKIQIIYVGHKILVQTFDKDEANRPTWKTVGRFENPWIGKGKENDGVMNRKHKPRMVDSQRLAVMFQKTGKIE